MEIKFKLATEPAIKAVIATGAFASIARIITNSPNVFDISGCVLITRLALVISTHRTHPLHACTAN